VENPCFDDVGVEGREGIVGVHVGGRVVVCIAKRVGGNDDGVGIEGFGVDWGQVDDGMGAKGVAIVGLGVVYDVVCVDGLVGAHLADAGVGGCIYGERQLVATEDGAGLDERD
jgi:hypothetical protein